MKILLNNFWAFDKFWNERQNEHRILFFLKNRAKTKNFIHKQKEQLKHNFSVQQSRNQTKKFYNKTRKQNIQMKHYN